MTLTLNFELIQSVGAAVYSSDFEDRPLVDVLLNEYIPYKWVAPLILSDEPGPKPSKDSSDKAQDIEKWLLVGFCSICILAMIVCIVVLIVYKVRKNRREREDMDRMIR